MFNDAVSYSEHSATNVLMVVRKAKVKKSRCGPEGSRRFRLPDFHDIQHIKVVRSSAPRIGKLCPQEMFLALIFTRG